MYSVEHYPAEDEKLRASRIVRRRGGNCANTLEVLQQLVNIDNVTSVPLVLSVVLPSTFSPGIQQIRASFGPTVDLTHCIYREECNEPASSYIIRSLSSDTRTLVNYNELPEMTSEEFIATADEVGNDLGWCHFEVSDTLSSWLDIAWRMIGRDVYQKSHWNACAISANTSLLSKSV